MCHPEVPEGHVTPEVARDEVSIPTSDGYEMPALLATPDHDSHSGVVVIADVFGRTPFYEDLAARLATAGFTALLPEYFFREGMTDGSREQALERRPKLSERQALADFDAAIGWLRERIDTPTEALTGTVGCCMGGTLVLHLAATRSDLASVCYYGFPAGSTGGRDLLPPPLDALDAITGPLVGFWGAEDEGVGMDNVAALTKGLEQRGVALDHTIYPGLAHGFLARSNLEPGNAGYQEACDSWTKTIGFYRAHL